MLRYFVFVLNIKKHFISSVSSCHSAHTGADRMTVKTPEKLLTRFSEYIFFHFRFRKYILFNLGLENTFFRFRFKEFFFHFRFLGFFS